MNRFSRTARLIGADAVKKLASSSVAVFGVGGVGSYIAESLARAGVGQIDLIDKDDVDVTNINRQLCALSSTVGQPKVEVMRDRILDINPDAKVNIYKTFYNADTADEFDLSVYDYIADAIDTVSAKLLLVESAKKAQIRIISAMGAGNKLDPTQFEVADISKTSVCPLAKVMRVELRRRGISHLKVVYSKEPPAVPDGDPRTPSSISFVPSVAGLIMSGEIIKDIINEA